MYQYSFANVDLLIQVPDASGDYQDVHVSGYGTGENLISVTRRAPLANVMFGAYGDMVVSMQQIQAADLSFQILMNAPENKILQDYANYFHSLARKDGELVYPIQGFIKDNMGNDQVTLTNGVILQMPALSRGQTMSTNTWTLTFEKSDFLRGDGDDAQSLGFNFI